MRIPIHRPASLMTGALIYSDDHFDPMTCNPAEIVYRHSEDLDINTPAGRRCMEEGSTTGRPSDVKSQRK